ncbi:MAG: hypothetical protein RLZZ467_83 [Gemmatimonadota bacterium]
MGAVSSQDTTAPDAGMAARAETRHPAPATDLPRGIMRIVIRPSINWQRSNADFVHRRLEFALGRFSNRIRSLHVRLTDENGPRGGPDKKCLIAVRLLAPSRMVVVEDVDVDEAAVVCRATERIARAVARAIDVHGRWPRAADG